MTEQVILVDSSDRERGAMEKMQAHLEGLLHRAVSVFIFNSQGELLLQRRAMEKYHSPGLWANTCCGHPRPGESCIDAASRRLKEEMGMSATLREVSSLIYLAPVGGNAYEHEFDHIFTGTSNDTPQPTAGEVCEWKWIDPEDIGADMDANPGQYAIWFQLIFKDTVSRFRAGR